MARGPSWWKMYAYNGSVVQSVPDEAAGAALKAAYRYFDGEEVTQGSLEPLAYTVFCVLKNGVDQAITDYEASRESGQRGAKARWGNRDPMGEDSPPIDPLCSPIGSNADTRDQIPETRRKDGGAAKPPRSPRFEPPTVEQVRGYCREKGYQVDPEGFVDHYASNGWKVGKAAMKDWKAAVRTWERRERPRVKEVEDDGLEHW